MKRQMKAILFAGVLMLAGLITGSEATAAEITQIKYSGKDGGVEWSIDTRGHLLLQGDGDYVDSPDWTEEIYASEIATAEVRVKNMTSTKAMFFKCEYLYDIDFQGFDTGKVTDMSKMFFGCTNIKKLDISGFRTGNVTDMSMMFSECANLKDLNLNHFDTGNVTNMSDMFCYCMELTDLQISRFSTGKLKNAEYMFYGSYKLAELDLSGWNLSALSNAEYMFGSTCLLQIKLPNVPIEIPLGREYYDKNNTVVKNAAANIGPATYVLADYRHSTCGTKPHVYEAPLFIWDADYKKAKAYFKCTRSDCYYSLYTRTIPAAITSKTIQPSLEKEGEIQYTATAVCDGKTYTDVRTVSIPKLAAKPVGTSLDFKTTNTFYRVTKAGKTPELAYMGPKNKNVKKVTIPATVKIDGVTYKVTSVADGALKNYKNLTTVTVGANVTKIGKNAFYGCKKLKKIIIKSKKLKSVGKNALKGIKKNATIDVPNSKKKAYKKLLKAKTGYKKTMKVK